MQSVLEFLTAEERSFLLSQMEVMSFQEDELIIREGGLNQTLFFLE